MQISEDRLLWYSQLLQTTETLHFPWSQLFVVSLVTVTTKSTNIITGHSLFGRICCTLTALLLCGWIYQRRLYFIPYVVCYLFNIHTHSNHLIRQLKFCGYCVACSYLFNKSRNPVNNRQNCNCQPYNSCRKLQRIGSHLKATIEF